MGIKFIFVRLRLRYYSTSSKTLISTSYQSYRNYDLKIEFYTNKINVYIGGARVWSVTDSFPGSSVYAFLGSDNDIRTVDAEFGETRVSVYGTRGKGFYFSLAVFNLEIVLPHRF